MKRFISILKGFSLVNVYYWLIASNKALFWGFVSKEVAKSREDVCKTCDQYDEHLVVCKICHCGVDSEATGHGRMFEKVYFNGEKCPLMKWR